MKLNFFNLKHDFYEISKLSGPIATAFISMGIMGIVDTIMVGNYNTTQLAYMGLANAIFMVLFTIPISLLQGVMIKASQKFGARKFASTGKIYNEGQKYLVILSVIFTVIAFLGEPVLLLLDQTPDMAENGGKLLDIMAPSIPFILLFVNANFFLQSIKRPHIAMYAALAGNIINIISNRVLIYGELGFPEMGAAGAATTTLVVRIALALIMLGYIYRMKRNPKLNKRFGLSRSYDTWWMDSKNTRKIGYGVAITTIATSGSFSAVNIFAGWLGAETLATFVILFSVSNLVFMICFAVAQGTSIVVANAYGRKDANGIISATLAGYILYFLTITVIGFFVVVYPQLIFGIFTNDAALMKIIEFLLFYVMLDLFIDSLPLNIVTSLNGQSDVEIPTLNQVISFLLVRVSGAYLLAFRFDMGLKGLILGLACGGLSSLLLNGARFVYLTRKREKLSYLSKLKAL